ncbi:2-hydroxyacid dehydrogenase [Streptomyces phytophilus]|uniref:2-hydroxyacid dehydrogenase n=1 Tax=Streptomyces phytophilus TaxID=722715 RepID=UPI002867DC60|nr:2-hydroxyacid dehydrogenase [Streptomyces phytophilus]
MSTPLHVLVTEPVMGRFRDVLTAKGAGPAHRWTFAYGRSPASGDESAVRAAAATADVLVCSAAPVELLAGMPQLRLLHVTGAGYDRIPLAALGPGVQVANTFHHGRSIAEHVMMVSMMLLRDVARAERNMRAGVWRNAVVDDSYPFGGVLAGRALGVLGLGEIGAAVARTATALGMRVRTVRRDPAAPLPAGVDVDWVGGRDRLHELLGGCDVVVVTVPLSEETRGLVDAAALAAMKPSAVLVNVARGPVVDEKALHAALSERTIAGAAVDVWWRNPREPGAPPPSRLDFTGFDNVVLTPHQSGHTEETFRGRARDIRDNVDALAEGRPLRNVVAP